MQQDIPDKRYARNLQTYPTNGTQFQWEIPSTYYVFFYVFALNMLSALMLTSGKSPTFLNKMTTRLIKYSEYKKILKLFLQKALRKKFLNYSKNVWKYSPHPPLKSFKKIMQKEYRVYLSSDIRRFFLKKNM